MPRDLLRSRHLRSVRAEICTHIQFFNSTNRHLHAYWIDYQGIGHVQFALEPKSNRSVNTYLTHPWFFRDSITGELMQVNHFNVFLPEFYSVPDPTNPVARIPCRKQIIIHLPLKTLKDICLWKVSALLKRNKEPENAINVLEIPLTLKMELRLILSYKRFQARSQ